MTTMKNINKFLATALVGLAITGCNDLNPEYLGSTVTKEQKEATLEAKPEMALAGVTGISANMNRCMAISNTHNDFGYASLMLGFDHLGTDINSRNVGYNWFAVYAGYELFRYTTYGPALIWNNSYNQINSANAVLQTISADTESEELMMYRAQALGFRAFDYWVLAQSFQRTYYGNESRPCVPVITDLNMEDAAANGIARNTVKEVYDQIIADLNEAIDLATKSGVKVESLIESKPRRMLNLDALYGLRARVYLTMHEYAKAAEDARKAIEVSSCSPLSIEEAGKPGFASFEKNWMWGIANAETDRVATSGIVNFSSHMSSFAYGYVTVGGQRATTADLYGKIPATDVRKNWFLDENYECATLTEAQREYLYSFGKGSVKDSGSGILPFQNVKFDCYKSVLGQSTNAADVPMMRVEEMYYILAEGLAMSGNTGEALQVLGTFEQTYRNPNFATKASTPEEIQELIWLKRRVEFWGEGLSWFDIKRLGKGVDRRGLGFPSYFVYNIEPDNESLAYIFPIPESEITSNKLIQEADNNPNLARPVPVEE